MKIVIEQLEKWKKEHRWTDAEVANFVGVSRAIISNILSGKVAPSLALSLVVLDKAGFEWAETAVAELLPNGLEKRINAGKKAALNRLQRDDLSKGKNKENNQV